MKGKGDASKMYDWAEGHWWETGLNLVSAPLLQVFATPQRMTFGLKQMVAYLHPNGVTAYMEPGALLTPALFRLYQQILGAEDTPFSSYFVVDGRAHTMVRSASVLKHRVPLSFHSDLPMGPSAPLAFMWEAVNRVTPAGHVVAPEQRIGVQDALRAVTIESAYSWRKEKELGSIAPGKLASFTIVEED